jgi:UDP-galactopyranose mutase
LSDTPPRSNRISNPETDQFQPPLICFSHLRWDFVFQRPQHLMTRLAKGRLVLIFEEPFYDATDAWIDVRPGAGGVLVATPHLAWGTPPDEARAILSGLLDEAGSRSGIDEALLWYYTPIMREFSQHRPSAAIVYDCMDELNNFKFAPPELRAAEQALFAAADVVFTGGHSLYEAKRTQHANVHAFPSSVDIAHFRGARAQRAAVGGNPVRLGYYGVIDERLDLNLIAAVAEARPDWTIEMVGPVLKIDEGDLPRLPNIEYFGSQPYERLPEFLGRWNVAIMPFAINDATRFISPTKTPEYLAGGRPVVSTPIHDVVHDYGHLAGVRIAGDPVDFIDATEALLALCQQGDEWLREADATLAGMSWDRTLIRMTTLIGEAAAKRTRGASAKRILGPAMVPKQARRKVDYLIVGAGFAGSVLAERLANDSGSSVLLIDKRPHVGGNAYDHLDEAGILVHRYGPHIFHTNSAEIFSYLSQFTKWRPYEHRVLASVRDQLVPIPINRTTLNALYGAGLTSDEEAAAFLAHRAEPRETIRTSEDVVVSAVGQELYETFFRGYTRKQWGLDPSELDKSVTARVPTRTNTDDRYFGDRFQAMPADGYTAMFDNMLRSDGISIELGTSYDDIVDTVDAGHVIYTGPIDEYFGYRYGKLPYRSLMFEHRTLDQEWLQPVAVVNYPDEKVTHTRVTEYKHLTGQSHPRTSITHEYPAAEGDPYYPVPRPENQALYKRYEELAAATPGVTFVGRLATYRYYNMDQIVGQALATYRRLGVRSDEVGAPAKVAST